VAGVPVLFIPSPKRQRGGRPTGSVSDTTRGSEMDGGSWSHGCSGNRDSSWSPSLTLRARKKVRTAHGVCLLLFLR
jgi:hypothetical protein